MHAQPLLALPDPSAPTAQPFPALVKNVKRLSHLSNLQQAQCVPSAPIAQPFPALVKYVK